MDTLAPLPDSFTIQRATLESLSGFWLDTLCACGSRGAGSLDALIEAHGRQLVVGELVRRLRCRDCRGLLAIYLVHGPYREPCSGHAPYWALALHRSPPHALQPLVTARDGHGHRHRHRLASR